MKLKILSIILCFCFIGATQTIIAQEDAPKEKTKKPFIKKKEPKANTVKQEKAEKKQEKAAKKQEKAENKNQKKTESKNQEKAETKKIQLKNGPSFEGKIIKQTPDSITIRLKSFSELTFHRKNIENTFPQENSSLQKHSNKYYYIIDLAYTFGKTEYVDSYYNDPFGNPQIEIFYTYRSGFNTQYTFGKKINPYINPEIALGFMTYRDANFMPLSIGVRGDLLPQNKATPYYYGGIGYAYMVKKKNSSYDTINNNRGFFYNYGVGLKLKGNKTNLLVSLGQQSQFMKWREQIQSGSFQVRKTWYNRYAIKLGIEF